MPLVSQRYLTRLSHASLRLSTLKVLPLSPAVILSSFLSYKHKIKVAFYENKRIQARKACVLEFTF